jgi:uncharacterized repeat protein (TIGR01451 family)
MNNIFKKIITMSVMFAIATTAFASSLASPTGIPVLKVLNGSSYSQSKSVSSGDEIWFQIHSYGNGSVMNEINNQIENLDNRTFNNGSSENVWASISASNANTLNGSSTLYFNDDVRLEYAGYQWYVVESGESTNKFTLSNNQNGSLVIENGVSLGNLNNNARSNFLVKFNAVHTTSDTSESSLSVTTRSASSVDEDSATLRGIIYNEDNIDVWFAFDENDTTPSCSSSSDEVSVSGNQDSGDSFSKSISNLDEGTRYYYRACAEDENGNIVLGSRVSFKTDTDSNNDNEESEVETNSPTRITKNSAQLNGYVKVNDTRDPRVYFIYGTSSSNMNTETSLLKVNSNTYFQSIQSLNENTQYYYKAVVTDRNGNIIDKGETKKFYTSINNRESTSAVTSSASPSFTVATLFGRINNGDGLVQCYFEYGSTRNLGLKSTRSIVNLYNTSSCSAVIRGLSSGSQYYYRTVVEDEGVKYTGLTKSFVQKTRAVTPQTTPVDTVQVTVASLQTNKQVSQERDSGYRIDLEALSGDTVFYKVRIVNNTDKQMNDIVITDTIPKGLELSGQSNYNEDAKFITLKIGSLEAGKSEVFITEMTVSANVDEGDIIESTADILVENKTETTNSVRINIVEENIAGATTVSGQGASIFGANSAFFPSTLIGWLGLIIFMLTIAFLISKLLATENSSKITLAELEAREAQKMSK